MFKGKRHGPLPAGSGPLSLLLGAAFITALALVAAGTLPAPAAGPAAPPAPRTAPPATRAATKPVAVTVATYNINYGNPDLPAVTRSIRKAKADVVFLQETNRASERYLRGRLGGVYPHTIFHHAARAGGFGVLSKWPMRKPRYLPRVHGLFGAWIGEIELADGWVQVANVHLMPLIPGGRAEGAAALTKRFIETEAVRGKEIVWLHGELTKGTPTIIAGDFNSPSAMSAPAYLTRHGFTDSFAAVTDQPDTQPTWHWLYNGVHYRFRLDYIFHTARFETRASRIFQGGGSDHYLLVSTLHLKPSPAPTTSRATKP